MKREILTLGPITIYWYSVLIITSIIIGYYFSTKKAKENGLGSEYITNLIFYVIPVSIIGARLYYVIFNFSVFKDNLLDIFKVWNGGLAIYGAVLSGAIFILYYAKKKKKSILLTLDTVVPYVLLGQAIGRWGNFFNKEAYGAITSFEYLKNIHIPNFIIKEMYINGAYRIPTFLYESIWNIIGFIIILIIRKRNNFKDKGLLVCIYSIWYGIGRFFIEGMRDDSLYLGTFRISQIVSIILVICGIVGIILLVRRRKWKKTK